MRHSKFAWLLVALTASACITQEPDQPALPPDALMTADGSVVDSAKAWRDVRRPEIIELFRQHMYGRAPAHKPLTIEAVRGDIALDGLARRKQWRVRYGHQEGAFFDVLMYAPRAAEDPVPAFLALNFFGNQTIHADPAIRMPSSWVRNNKQIGVADNRPLERSRGARASCSAGR